MSFNQFFGVPASCEQFVKEHPVFSAKLTPLSETISKIFVREGFSAVAADALVFFLGRKCFEEFLEIVLLAANGYSVGPMKLLRSLYENAVVMAYLAKQPGEAEAFLAYHPVHVNRAHEGFKRVFGNDAYEADVPEESIKLTKEEFAKVRDRFFTSSCNKCDAKSVQGSWTKKDIEAMARIAGDEYKFLYMDCYFFPMLQLHTTPQSIMPQIQTVNGKLTFDIEFGKQLIDGALSAAHQLIVQILFTQNDHFKLGLDEELIQRFQDFTDSWPEREQLQEVVSDC